MMCYVLELNTNYFGVFKSLISSQIISFFAQCKLLRCFQIIDIFNSTLLDLTPMSLISLISLTDFTDFTGSHSDVTDFTGSHSDVTKSEQFI